MSEIHHFNAGKFECVAINDGGFAIDAGTLFANAPEEALAQALDRHGERAASISSTWTCLLVNTGAELVLIDTGGGPGSENGGKLPAALTDIGIDPEEIDIVVLTHIHADHSLGAVRDDGTPVFAHATYVMGETEWAYWTRAEALPEAPQWATETAQKVLPALEERIRTIAAPGTVVPGIRLIPAFGHTPGHCVVEIGSGGEKLLYLSDTALHPIHLEHPHWVATLDQDPDRAVKTRKALFRRAAEQKQRVLLFHFKPFPSLGYIVAEGEAWRWRESHTFD